MHAYIYITRIIQTCEQWVEKSGIIPKPIFLLVDAVQRILIREIESQDPEKKIGDEAKS